MTSALSAALTPLTIDSQVSHPIKIWSPNQAISEGADLMSPDSPEAVDVSEVWQPKTPVYGVLGLAFNYPKEQLSFYDIPQPFWEKFIAAMNAALSQYPVWKDPSSVRRKRALSFSESSLDMVCFDSHEPSQLNQAERVLKWWNDDYFHEKGCRVVLDFKSSPSNQTEYSEPFLLLSSF